MKYHGFMDHPKFHLMYSRLIYKVYKRELVVTQSRVNHCTISFEICFFFLPKKMKLEKYIRICAGF